jgi:LuxR family maltose regulon positive regulatory protein
VRRDGPAGVRLTSRELTLVELLSTHLSYAEIGDRLFLSVNTVESNLKALSRKLDATTRAEAVDASRRAGLL